MESKDRSGIRIPVFRMAPGEKMEDFVRRCADALAGAVPGTGALDLPVGAVQLDAGGARAFVAAQEERCGDSFGQTVVRLDRAQMRRGRFVTLFPEMEAEGLPCEILCLDLTDAPALPEDGAELAAVLDFLDRFGQQGVEAWVLAEQTGPLMAGLEAALAAGYR